MARLSRKLRSMPCGHFGNSARRERAIARAALKPASIAPLAPSHAAYEAVQDLATRSPFANRIDPPANLINRGKFGSLDPPAVNSDGMVFSTMHDSTNDPRRWINTVHQSRSSPASRVAVHYPLPYGAILHEGGVQFVVFSRSATAMRLLLYDNGRRSRAEPKSSTSTPTRDRWGDIWSIFVPGIGPGQLYHFQADGPFDPRARPALRRHGPADRPLRPGPGGQFPAGRRRHRPAAQVRGDRRHVRLAGGPPSAAQPGRDRDLRDARPRLHARRAPAASTIPARTWA